MREHKYIKEKIKIDLKGSIEFDAEDAETMDKFKNFLEELNKKPGTKIDIERVQNFIDVDKTKKLPVDGTNALEQTGENILNNIDNLKIPE